MASAIWSKAQVPVAMAVTTPMVDHAERLYLQFEFFNWMYKFKVWCPKIHFPHKSLEVAPVRRSGGGIILCCVLSNVGSLVPSRAKGLNLLPYWVQGYDVGCTYPCGYRVGHYYYETRYYGHLQTLLS